MSTKAELKAQILAAQKEGYSNNEILSHLMKGGNQEVQNALNEGYSPDEVMTYILSEEEKPKETPQATAAPAAPITQTPVKSKTPAMDMLLTGKISGPLGMYAALKERYPTIEDVLADVGKLTRFGASGAVGGIAGILTPGGPGTKGLAGSGAMAATDVMLKKFTGEKPETLGGQELNPLEEILYNTALNEAGGRLIGGAYRLGRGAARTVRELVAPGSVVGDTLKELAPTFSQYAKPGVRKFSQFLEDTFQAARKSVMGEQSEKLAFDKANQLVTDVSTRKLPINSSSEYITTSAQNRLIDNFEQSNEAVGLKSEALSLLGKLNIAKIPQPQDPITGKMRKSIIVEGPTELPDAINAAKDILTKYSKKAVKLATPEVRAAGSIIRDTGATFDSNGNLLDFKPVSIAQALSWKKEFGTLAYGDPMKGTPGIREFEDLYNVLDNDILNSVSKWNHNSQDGLDLYNEITKLTDLRNRFFNPGGRAGKNTTLLLTNLDQANEPIDPAIQSINRIVDSPTLLRRALYAGDLETVMGKRAPTIKLVTGLKKDLQAYNLKRMFDNALDKKTGVFNTEKLFADWSNSEKSEAAGILYNNADRAKIHQFLKDLTHFEQKGGSTYSAPWFRVRAGSASLSLISGITTHLLSGGNLPLSALVGTAVLPIVDVTGRMVARAMTDKNAARIMQAMVSGQALGMSQKAAARILAYAWRKEPVTAIINGREVHGTFNADGKFVTEEQ